MAARIPLQYSSRQVAPNQVEIRLSGDIPGFTRYSTPPNRAPLPQLTPRDTCGLEPTGWRTVLRLGKKSHRRHYGLGYAEARRLVTFYLWFAAAGKPIQCRLVATGMADTLLGAKQAATRAARKRGLDRRRGT